MYTVFGISQRYRVPRGREFWSSFCGISTLFHFWLHISATFIQIKSCQHADMYLCCMLQLYLQKFGSLVGFGTNPPIPTYKTGELKWMPHIYADVDILQGRLLVLFNHNNCDWFAALWTPSPWKTQRGILMSPYDYSFATPPRNRNYGLPSPWNDSLWKYT